MGRILALFPRPTQIFSHFGKKSSGGVAVVSMPIEARGRFGGQNWSRSGVQPPTGTRLERSIPAECPPATPNLESPPPRESSCFLSSIQCPRVGGAFRSGVQPPTGTRLERSIPAEYPPATPNLESPPPRESSCFLSSIQCPRVGGSFRSGVQPPTGTRLERSIPAECPPATPNLESPPPCESSCFLSSIQCPCVGGSFRSGVQPPTGTRPTGSANSIPGLC